MINTELLKPLVDVWCYSFQWLTALSPVDAQAQLKLVSYSTLSQVTSFAP